MIPKSEIKRRYALIEGMYGGCKQGVIVCYECPHCAHVTKTLTVAEGIVPNQHNCENCNTLARRNGIADPVPNKPHTQEWHRPGVSELLKSDNSRYIEQVLQGLLFSRILSKHTPGYINKQF